jgi:hypothetical protein
VKALLTCVLVCGWRVFIHRIMCAVYIYLFLIYTFIQVCLYFSPYLCSGVWVACPYHPSYNCIYILYIYIVYIICISVVHTYPYLCPGVWAVCLGHPSRVPAPDTTAWTLPHHIITSHHTQEEPSQSQEPTTPHHHITSHTRRVESESGAYHTSSYTTQRVRRVPLSLYSCRCVFASVYLNKCIHPHLCLPLSPSPSTHASPGSGAASHGV